jgi:TRAP-type transport system periplasmic protein
MTPTLDAKPSNRNLRRYGVIVLGALLLSLLPTDTLAKSRSQTISIATVAPKHSPWGKVLRAWAIAVKKKSKGRLKLKFYWNGQQGDEGAVVAKMRAGQLDGAALNAVGLSKIYPPILALQMPGLFRDWKALDRARKKVFPRMRKGFAKAGFVISDIGDVGRARTMSKGSPVTTPADLRRMKPARLRGDLIGPTVSAVVGFTAVPVSIPELLPALSQGRIDIITAPPLAAEQLQWTPELDYLTDEVVGIAISALVLSKKRLDGLDGDLVKILRKTGKKATAIMRKKIRKEDDAAYKRLKRKLKVVKPTAAQKANWAKLFKKVRQRLARGTFPPDLVAQLEKLAQK